MSHTPFNMFLSVCLFLVIMIRRRRRRKTNRPVNRKQRRFNGKTSKCIRKRSHARNMLSYKNPIELTEHAKLDFVFCNLKDLINHQIQNAQRVRSTSRAYAAPTDYKNLLIVVRCGLKIMSRG